MPTFSAIAFDRFLEPGSLNPKTTKPDEPMRTRHVSPALYATPEATQLPLDSSPNNSSFSPISPYVINHKIRGPRLSENNKKIENNNTNDNNNNDNDNCGDHESEREGLVFEERVEIEEIEEEDNLERESDNVERERDNLERESENEDFFEFNESMSINLSEDGNGFERSFKPGTPNGEFFDAFEEISSEGGSNCNTYNKGNKIEEEMREIRLSLLMEIEKRKQSEESLNFLKNEWLKLSHQLSLLGLNLPPPIQNSNSNLKFEFESDPAEELCDQIRVSRVVNEAVIKGISRAELADEIEEIVKVKNFEISRLMDRVQYYEAANKEMTHRNQEAIEMARQERNRKQRRQKWFYASLGLAVTLGSATIVWSYLPASRSVQLDHNDASSSTVKS